MGVYMRESYRTKVPSLGEKFHFFDAGRKNANRHFIVEIIKVIPWRCIAARNFRKSITQEQEKHPELFAESPDYICQGKILGLPLEPIWFTRTADGGWYSVGFWSGILDIDGTIFDSVVSDLATAKMITKDEARKSFNKSSRIPDYALLNVVEVI
jgi:hypothetical protein